MKHDLTPFKSLILVATPLNPVPGKSANQIRGQLQFIDQSTLFIRENYVLESDWIDYSYHWQAADHQIINRWDNAHSVPFDTSPHHQHVGSEENIQPSEPMTLEKVLTHIAARLSAD
jgi:hypothetical protein